MTRGARAIGPGQLKLYKLLNFFIISKWSEKKK